MTGRAPKRCKPFRTHGWLDARPAGWTTTVNYKPDKRSFLALVLHPALFAVAYFAAAELGQALSFTGNFASFWPPSGVYLAVLLVANIRRWPAFLFAALCANFTTDVLCRD